MPLPYERTNRQIGIYIFRQGFDSLCFIQKENTPQGGAADTGVDLHSFPHSQKRIMVAPSS